MNEMKYNCILNSYLMPWEANPEPVHLQILHNAEILHVNSVCKVNEIFYTNMNID